MQRNGTEDGSSNIKDFSTERFQQQMTVLHQSMCISKAGHSILRYIRAEYKDNKNASTGRANCKKATRHHAHFPLIAKSRKSNDGQSRKEQKTSSWAIF